MTTYYKNPAAAVTSLLRDAFGEAGPIKAFYNGDPGLIGQSSLPAIAVILKNSHHGYGPTGFDKVTHTIQIRVIFNKRDDYGSPDSQEVDLTNQKLQQIIRGRDDTTGIYLPNTIMGVLRGNVSFNQPGFALNPQLTQVDDEQYYVVPHPDDTVTDEAHIDVTIDEYIAVSRV